MKTAAGINTGILVLFIAFSFMPVVSADSSNVSAVLYLKDEVQAVPGDYRALFLCGNISEQDMQCIERALSVSRLMNNDECIIRASELQYFLPAGFVLIGSRVLYRPEGTEAAGHEMSTVLAENSGNNRHSVSASVQFRGGDILPLRMDTGGISIQMNGRLLSSGNPGDHVYVIVQGTGKRISVRLSDDGSGIAE